MMNQCAIAIKNLTVAYHNKPVLYNVSAQIPHGVLMAIIGPNGAGKTTLIKSIIQLIQPIAGTITIFGGSYTQHRHHIAYIPQCSSVDWDFPITVFDTVMMGLYGSLGWFKRPGTIEKNMVAKALHDVGLSTYAHSPISELSGGQQQRVFLARALVQDAAIYLLDEPFIGIDSTAEKTIITLLKKLRDQGKTIIVVHHDLHTVEHYFDWLLLLNKKHIASGPLDHVFTPEHLSTAYETPITIKQMHQ